jgi:formamidopyrimidine-DNA glycosylase
MPELPEVETVRRGLETRVLGHRITTVKVSNPQVIVGSLLYFRKNARGVIRHLHRKGKALALELGPAHAEDDARTAHYLLLRLGMTGQVTVVPREHPLEPHTHVRFALENREEIRYRDVRRFGRLRCCTPLELRAIFGELGPDAPTITAGEFLEALQGRRAPIKSWLMDQSRLAGVGNIYADESLFAARIHPLTKAGRLSRPRALALHRAVEKVLRSAVALQGTSFRDYIDIEGQPGRFSMKLKVYQRTDEPCPRCSTAIERMVIAGRSSHFCPRCQPPPRRRSASAGA